MERLKKTLWALLPLIVLIISVCVWEITAVIVNNEFVLPSARETAVSLAQTLASGQFYLALLTTLLRSVIGFTTSFILAFSLAILSEKSKTADRVLQIVMAVIRALPTIAVVLLIVLWTNSFIAPIIVTALVVLPTSYTGIKSALSGVDREVIECCKLYGVSKKKILLKVILPSIMPSVLRQAGANLSLNLKLMVAAEVLSQTANSIGYLLNFNKVYFETSTMVALVVVIIALGVAIEFVFNAVAKRGERKYL